MKENQENQEDELMDTDSVEPAFDSEISDLNHLINTILDYYSFTQIEEGEEWKKGTSHEHNAIPEDLNDLIKSAFKTQIKKFIK